MINEPWAGDVWKDPSLLIPGVAERKLFQPAYDYIASRIHKVDTRHIIFFEPVTWDNMFPTGFSHPPGGAQYANRSVLSYHYYFPPDLSASSTVKARYNDSRTL